MSRHLERLLSHLVALIWLYNPELLVGWIANQMRLARKSESAFLYRQRNAELISARRKAKYRENPEGARSRAAKWYAAHREQALARINARYHTDPIAQAKIKADAVLWRLADEDRYRESQLSAPSRGYPVPTRPRPDFCECCGRAPEGRGLALDHCHITGIFRGWLCATCNMGIGALGDTLEAVTAAVGYLKRSVTVAA